MSDIRIPPEVVEAARLAVAKAIVADEDGIASAIKAALAAWPGAFPHTFRGPLEGTGYVLPMSQKEPRT
jgi:hypothetical protein